MPNLKSRSSLAAASESVAHPMDFDEFLEKLSPKDRLNAEKRLAVLEAEPEACSLMTLAPFAKFVGKQTIQFYIPDGKYRMQVFALEDLQDGHFTIYSPNVLEEAAKAGVFAPAPHTEPHMHMIEGTDEPLRIEPLDKNSINPGAHFKDMLGWNRKAVRITLPPSASRPQIDSAVLLCAIAAQHFVRTEPPAVAPAKKR
jgi:hypothetical protein